MNLDELRNDIIIKQKKGLPFIITSVVIWLLITVVAALQIDIMLKNILVFCCSTPLLPLAWKLGKKMGVDIFSKANELGSLGLLFTTNPLNIFPKTSANTGIITAKIRYDFDLYNHEYGNKWAPKTIAYTIIILSGTALNTHITMSRYIT